MIKIDKSTVPTPDILAPHGRGARALEKLKEAFNNGHIKFSFESSIYGDKSVKAALKVIQHNKCCFCESPIAHISHGDVEHFRPKAGYQIDEGQALVKPGYYWLVYDFTNLFLCCQVCNQIYKKNYFPLVNETQRAKSHHDDYTLEDSLILHPAVDNIDDHLFFEAEIIKPKNNSQKGIETIKRTGLNREFLLRERLDYLKKLRLLEQMIREGNSHSDEIKTAFKEWGQATSLYSAMVRANFPELI